MDAALGAEAVPLAGAGANRAALVERVLSGGFPDVVARREEHDREPWLRAYVTSVVHYSNLHSVARLYDGPAA